MQIRKPSVAGQFYPGQHNACIAEINEYLDQITPSESLPETIVAGIVPHAGWVFSGSLAAMVFSAIKQQNAKVHTFVVFGAAHSYFGDSPAVYDRGSWSTPIGDIAIDEDLANAVLKSGKAFSDTDAHELEHSIEVQVPFIQHLFAGAKLLPILVPPNPQATALGQAIGEIITNQEEKNVICIGSTDLTHYGPRYGFTRMGTGPEALNWASKVNDREFINLALRLEANNLLKNAAENSNSCGPGAAAAAVAAAKELGRTKGILLCHANSSEIMLKKMGNTSPDSVGYAAIVF